MAGVTDHSEVKLKSWVTLEFRRYQRQFVRPLQTAHGPWRSRQGLILRLRTSAVNRLGERQLAEHKLDEGQSLEHGADFTSAPDCLGQRSVYNHASSHRSSQANRPPSLPPISYGEIAPIPWFGTETLDEAINFLTPLQAAPSSLDDLSAIVEGAPSHYSATRFGLGLAIAQLQGHFPSGPSSLQPAQICALLPSGPEALAAWPKLWKQGHRTFKWKLGMTDFARELATLEQLRRSLPSLAQLRLDANGGLDLNSTQACLTCCDALAEQNLPIEFLEQPLPPNQFDQLLQLSQTYQTPLALDESVTGLRQLQQCYAGGWRGIFVIKGAIAGDPLAVVDFCQRHQLKVVFSSVFETALARQAVLAMAHAANSRVNFQGNSQTSQPTMSPAMPHTIQPFSSPAAPNVSRYAQGFGVEHWLVQDGLNDHLSIGWANGLTHSSNIADPCNDHRGGLSPAKGLQIQGETLWNQLSNG